MSAPPIPRLPWIPPIVAEHALLASLVTSAGVLPGVVALLQIGISCRPGTPGCTQT